MSPDIVNALFEMFGAFACAYNVYMLYKDKIVSGVSILSTAFFSSWGFWNVFYYSHLGQVFSWYAGICLATLNTIWVCQMFYYSKIWRPMYERD